ncbi:hypothetical protein JCM8097_001896 [Rhodosporidiobolus ruineniae]
MSHNHPLAPHILPACKRFPHQGAALFQSFVDLSLAQQWRDLEVVELDECGCAVLRGRPKNPKKAPPAVVLPMNLTTPTSLASLTSILSAVSSRFPPSSASSAPSADSPSSPSTDPSTPSAGAPKPDDQDPTTIYLAIVEKDSSIVYYVLRNGIVSPKEVPE